MITRHATSAAVLLLIACGGGEGDSASSDVLLVAPIAKVAPAFSLTLGATDATILDPRDVIETDTALYLLDGRTDELWIVPFAGPVRAPRLVGSLRQFGQGTVFAMSAHPRGIGVTGVDGSLRLMADTNPSRLVRTWAIAAPMRRPLALAGGSDGSWLAAHSHLGASNGRAIFLDSIVVTHIFADGRHEPVWAFERVGASRPDAFMTDRVAAASLPDTIVLVGAAPARVMRVTVAGVVIDTLRDVPQRALNANERAGLRRTRESPRMPQLRQAALPEARPAILRARTIGRATFVSAQAGEQHLSLDLYCDLRFRETLLESGDLTMIFFGPRGATVLRDEIDAGRVRLDFHEWTSLRERCA